MIDAESLSVVDVHCHPFLHPGPLDAEAFTKLTAFPGGSEEYMAEAGVPANRALVEELHGVRRDVLYHRYLVHQLADALGCAHDLEDVVAARNAAVADGYAGYVKSLFDDCGLTTLIADFGYPQPPIEVARFAREVPCEVVPIYRIEPLITELLDSGCGWAEFRTRYDEAISNALEREGFRGLKSIIAYRTGLDVSPLSRTPDQGLLALDAIRRGLGGQATKQLRDHLLCRALELCIEHDVPMQIHTGIGDYEVDLVRCRPALLMDLLRFPTFRPCHVLLVHTGYPYHAEAGYLANVLPRVYCDLSEGIPFAAHAARRIISEVLEMAPISKVVFGSDGFGTPEINYVGAKLGKQALAQALQELVDVGMLSLGEARRAAELILSENARRLYGMDPKSAGKEEPRP
jgi:hypothetical protein